MIDIKTLPFKERNIRKYKGNYAVRFMRRANTLSEAKKIKSYIEQFINCVNIYQDKNNNMKFIVQTYKEYKDLETAIRVRNFLDEKLNEYRI